MEALAPKDERSSAVGDKLAAALAWAARGFRVFPLAENTKDAPLWPGWTETASADPAVIAGWWRDPVSGMTLAHNIGVLTTGLIVADLDMKDGKNGVETFVGLDLAFETLTVRTPSGGFHVYYHDAGFDVGNSQQSIGRGIDVRAFHGYVLAPGSEIDGRAYVVEIDEPVALVPATLLSRCKLPGAKDRRTTSIDLDTPSAIALATAHLEAAAPATEGQGGDARTFQVACEVRDLGVSEPVALELMSGGWNGRCAPPWDLDELTAKVANAYAYAQNVEGKKHPIHDFGGVVIEPVSSGVAAPPPPMPVASAADLEDALLPVSSEIALAERLAAAHPGALRFVSQWGQWLLWSGAVWKPDQVTAVFDMARRVCRQAAGEVKEAAVAMRIASARTVAAIERIAKSLPGIASVPEQFDADPWLLNTPGGVVNLKTGEMSANRASGMMTKITAAAPGGDCPLWIGFLDRVTGGDRDMQAYLARVAGYALTGSTAAHALFFLYGAGGNGKGVFINTLTAVLGDYAKVAPMEMFTLSIGDRHPADMAMLRGARLVAAQETEAGRAWAEGKIKTLTGGDPITARHMRQDFFTYQPQFKLLFAGNHKPALRSVDEAIRRRFHLSPFSVSIPTAERDAGLQEKLKAEAGGILAWAIRGSLDHQTIGLAPPTAVRDATADYLLSEDAMTLWLTECCSRGPENKATIGALFSSWQDWSKRSGEAAGSRKAFSQWLTGQGFERWREGGTGAYGFKGLAPKHCVGPDLSMPPFEAPEPIGRGRLN